MKFLIFGSTGFIGKHLSQFLKIQGHEVFCISKSGNNNSMAVDVSDEKAFFEINFLPDIIVNCASRIPKSGKTSKDPRFLKELFLTNVIGATNISNWAVQKGIAKIINCSTLVVVKKPWPKLLTEDYSNVPDGPHVGYCMSKLSQEQVMNEIIKGSNTKLLHVRLSSVYGIGMIEEGIIFNLLKKLKENAEIKITTSENTLDFINIVDVCKSINALGISDFENGIINLTNGKPISLRRLVGTLKDITGSKSPIIYHNSDDPISEANISVQKLINCIGKLYNEFMPFEEGLKSLIRKN